ncbi:MAG: hypothetical protein ACP5JJ_10160 [Anaerolineae bacterium]
MSRKMERFWYPFTATTVIARKLVPLLLFTLGIGCFVWAGREYYYWTRPWAVVPEASLGLLSWAAAAYFFTLLPEIRAGDEGIQVRRGGLFWRRIPWRAVASVDKTAQIDLLGWSESLYTVYVWRPVAGRRGRVRRDWHRRRKPAFRFSGHIGGAERLLDLINRHTAQDSEQGEHTPSVGEGVQHEG